tara:strand:- start:353 stop:460 length:108 start_codon:yes stop_codon:yes gene_type:complete
MKCIVSLPLVAVAVAGSLVMENEGKYDERLDDVVL